MSLNDVRQQFATLSGRHDLVADFSGDDFDNASSGIGADFFLDAGQKMLDRKASLRKLYGWYKKDLTSGEYKLKIQQACVIKEVWAMPADSSRYQIEKKDYNWIRKTYGDTYTDLTVSSPIVYCPLVMNLSPEQAALTSSNYTDDFTYDAEEILFADQDDTTTDHYNHHGILLMPPADETYTVSILARFRSIKLTADVKTVWTEVHPEILVLAGLYSLESFYRNTEGMKDYMSAIVDHLNDLDKDVVEEEAQDLDSMWG